MKSIVLSCDKYHPFAHHMVTCYEDLWPDHPFEFLVPCNTGPLAPAHRHPRITYICAAHSIKRCALQMLEGIGDDEWVYWAIDDKYPMHLNVRAVQKVYDFVATVDDPRIAGLCFSRSRGFLEDQLIDEDENVTVAKGIKAVRRKRYNQIWYHQFLRAKVLRHMFNAFPDRDFRAKEMDYFIDGIAMPHDHKLYVTQRNYSQFGESTTLGKMTANCHAQFVQKGLPIPDAFEVAPERIIMGYKPTLWRQAANWVRGRPA